MALSLEEEFVGVVSALEARHVEYAVVGALAVAIWGAARATKDIDLLVRLEDVDTVLEIARSCGFRFEAAPMKFRDMMEIRRTSKVSGQDVLTLDLLIVNENLEPAWRSRRRVMTAAGAVSVVSREALIKMKAASNRPQDLFDIERLEDLDR